ncbi:MAG TPA: DUF928 domain-containing protein [Methylomirabilota bacterium]|nr:DUF928 domain-containing protein [Methylomirabilota bacterium]
MSAALIPSNLSRATIASVAIVLAAVVGPAAVLDAQQPAESRDVKAGVAAPVYKPPLRGAPGGRVGGGTRGTGREAFVLSVLAPNHTGLTTSEQPALFWFISSSSSYPIELTLVDPEKTEPLVELRIPPPVAAGVHRVRLADHGVRLAPGIAYQWYVAVVPDTGRRSKDILAGGTIERVPAPADLAAKLSGASRAALVAVYADAGLWYDALATLGDLIDQAPQDRALLEQRSALLRQVGLPDAN